MNKKSSLSHIFGLGVAGLIFSLCPTAAFAQQPEKDCGKLEAIEQTQFDNLSMEMEEALGNEDYETALDKAIQIFAICTTDVYSEYNLASLYDLNKKIPEACYHYDRLRNRPEEITKSKEYADYYKRISKKYDKTSLKDECPKYAYVEITCAMKSVDIYLNPTSGDAAASVKPPSCPFYGYVLPGTYQLKASKQGFTTHVADVEVTANGLKYAVPELEDPKAFGILDVICPRNAKAFTLTDSKGKAVEHPCPWSGKVLADSYTIKLKDDEKAQPISVVVERQGQTTQKIEESIKTNCSATPLTQTSTPLVAGAFAVLAALGLAVRRRREA